MRSKAWEALPPDSRFWCFSSAKPWSPAKQSMVDQHLDTLCAEWAAHGSPVMAGFCTVERRLIALAVDEWQHAASGCSIDSRMKALTALSIALDIDLFGRMHIHHRQASSSDWQRISLSEAKKAEGEFLNTVADKKGLWSPILSVKDSWLCPTKRG